MQHDKEVRYTCPFCRFEVKTGWRQGIPFLFHDAQCVKFAEMEPLKFMALCLQEIEKVKKPGKKVN